MPGNHGGSRPAPRSRAPPAPAAPAQL